MAIAGFIQAGGQSSRMGADKAWLPLGDRSVIEWVWAALKPVVGDLALIANRRFVETDEARYLQLGLPVYYDSIPNCGPLSGLHASLTNTKHDHILAVACDLPFASSALFKALIAARADYQIVVPLNEQGKLEPLCALYARDCLPEIEHLLKQAEYAPRRLFERLRTRYLAWAEIADLPGASHFFLNLNTPADYHRAQQIAAERLNQKRP